MKGSSVWFFASLLACLLLGSCADAQSRKLETYDDFIDSGFAAARKDRIADAELLFNKALQMDSNRVEGWFGLGYCRQVSCFSQGKMCPEAISCYTRVIQANPAFRHTYFNRAVCKGIMKDHAGAIADYTEQLKISPEDAESFCNRGIDKILSGDKQGGCADLDKAIFLGDDKAKAVQAKLCK